MEGEHNSAYMHSTHEGVAGSARTTPPSSSFHLGILLLIRSCCRLLINVRTPYPAISLPSLLSVNFTRDFHYHKYCPPLLMLYRNFIPEYYGEIVAKTIFGVRYLVLYGKVAVTCTQCFEDIFYLLL